MDLRSLKEHLTAKERIDERRRRIEEELYVDLSLLDLRGDAIGGADEKNCEQMFGAVPIPVGYAGPLRVTFSSGETHSVHLPLATTEGALIASVNRGCKALTQAGGVRVSSKYHGVSRSLAFRATKSHSHTVTKSSIEREAPNWKVVGEATSSHLKILRYELDESGDYLFLTLYADTDEAMGMNMVSIAGNAIGKWIEKNLGLTFVTVAGNADSDKKPSIRVKARGRGHEVTAEATLTPDIIGNVLKTTPEALLEVATAKLTHGSKLAGAIGANLHAANVIAALYIATGQDVAHAVEGSLAETTINESTNKRIHVRVRVPALLVGIRGGGTELPAQRQCLNLLLQPKGVRTPDRTGPNPIHPCRQLAESIGAAVLAGELSLLAALSSHHLASAHVKLGRGALRSL